MLRDHLSDWHFEIVLLKTMDLVEVKAKKTSYRSKRADDRIVSIETVNRSVQNRIWNERNTESKGKDERKRNGWAMEWVMWSERRARSKCEKRERSKDGDTYVLHATTWNEMEMKMNCGIWMNWSMQVNTSNCGCIRLIVVLNPWSQQLSDKRMMMMVKANGGARKQEDFCFCFFFL